MHNCYLFILCCLSCFQLFFNSIYSSKINTSIDLIDSYLIEESINLDSLLESSQNGLDYIELDKERLKTYVKETLTSSFPMFKFDIYYYFYDAKSLQSCSIDNIPCNSVQIKIIINYKKLRSEKIIRYELRQRD